MHLGRVSSVARSLWFIYLLVPFLLFFLFFPIYFQYLSAHRSMQLIFLFVQVSDSFYSVCSFWSMCLSTDRSLHPSTYPSSLPMLSNHLLNFFLSTWSGWSIFLSYLSYLSKLSHLSKLPSLANLSNLPNLATLANIASLANLANLPIPIYLSSLFWPILV